MSSGKNKAFYRAMCAANCEEGANNDDEYAPGDLPFPPEARPPQFPVVVQPHTSVGLEAKEDAEGCTNQ